MTASKPQSTGESGDGRATQQPTMGRWLLGMALVAGLIALTVPGAVRRRHQIQRARSIETLAVLTAAKEAVALERGLEKGATPGIEDLIADSKVIEAEPVFPPGASYELKPVGEFPIGVFRGETLTPLTDYDKTYLASMPAF
jgi:hypothetical protein